MENGKHHVFNSEHFPKPLELPEDVAKYGLLEGYARQSLMEDVLTNEELATIIRRASEATDVVIIRESPMQNTMKMTVGSDRNE